MRQVRNWDDQIDIDRPEDENHVTSHLAWNAEAFNRI
jgi:hypothetical protein